MDSWCLVSFLAKGEGEKKRFQYCLNPYSSDKFMYFWAIQGHSGGTLVDLTLQDNVLLPGDFAEYINHIGSAFEMHSIIKSGLMTGGKSLRRSRQSVFLTAVNPMCARQDLEEVEYDLDKPSIAVYKHTWRIHQNTVYWCNFKLAQTKGLQFYQTRSHSIALFKHTTCVLHWESGFHEVWRRTLLQSVSVTQATSRNTRAELASRSEECTYHGFEKIRWSCERSS